MTSRQQIPTLRRCRRPNDRPRENLRLRFVRLVLRAYFAIAGPRPMR